ncbi:MAG TPA: phosphoribosylamine--glycine ligase [Nitrospira sp.]|jgi:phosphoribosylamine--glycine ligase|nr:phosphoribosylamine--glycine ligase [Nitrospira sp.]
MKILIVGSGGREHALVWKISQSPRKPQIFCTPGNAGMEGLATCLPFKADDLIGLRDFALKEHIDLTVIGPEAPLALGIADEFRKARLKIFGPTKAAARLESSKSFSKEIMTANRIPTARARSFERMDEALAYLDEQPVPIVVKADGLAQGKGVVVATTREEATQAVRDAMEKSLFGQAGHRVLIEEFLDGEELTIMAFTDGKTVVPMVPAQDHKRVGDGDTGLNTGGMGAYAPAPVATTALREQVTREILQPTVDALARLGCPFQGVLYAGLMLVKNVPYVLEFNARMGDPETEVVLPLLQTDLIDVMEAVVEHRLDQLTVEWRGDAAVCVVMTSPGYPGSYQTGLPIQGLTSLPSDRRVIVFHAGTKKDAECLVTAGGRVLAVTAWGPSLRQARELVYQTLPSIRFDGQHYRTDIAHRALVSKS